GAAGVGGGVGHDEASAATRAERAVEDLDPQIVAVVDLGHAEREARGVVLDTLLIDLVDVEGRIGHDEVELAGAAVQVFVVGVALGVAAGGRVDGQVHGAGPHRLGAALRAVDADLGAGAAVVALHKAGALDEHTARAAGRIEDPAVVGLDHLDDQLDQRGG